MEKNKKTFTLREILNDLKFHCVVRPDSKMGKMKELLNTMERDADDAAVKEYVAQSQEAAEVLRKLLVRAQKQIEALQDELEQTKDLVEDYRQGLVEV